MESGFKDPLKIKNQRPKDKPIDGKNTPWDYRCPQYDQRSSCFVKAGTDYGVGHRQPVGTKKHSGKYAVPVGKVNTMKVDET
jgi:hypothetical protein